MKADRYWLFLTLGSLLLVSFSCKGGRSQGKATKAGPFSLEARLVPDPPGEKGNALVVQLKEESGKPVEGAELTVVAKMPAMGSMPEMKSVAKVSSEGAGRFRAAFDLPMSGTWTLEVAIKAPAGSATARYSVTVGSPGLSPIGAAGGQKEGKDQSAMKPGEAEEVTIEPVRRQKIGIRTGKVERRPLVATIRAPGRVTYDETRFVDVTLKFGGWVSKLLVNTTGQPVRKGDVLFSLYSPDLVTTQEEYLLASKTLSEMRSQPSPDPAALERAKRLVGSSLERLRLWGISQEQVREIPREGEALLDMPILSPATGYVIEKEIVEGAAVDPGKRLYRIASLDPIWIEAEVYESDLALVKVGQEAKVTLPYLPGRDYSVRVNYLYPYLEGMTRTARVRLEIPNPKAELQPAMYASVDIRVDLGSRLVVPEEAVVYTGSRRIAFVDLGEGRLRPMEIRTGIRSDGWMEILEGLKEGDAVVVSGNFLVAAESRLRSATRFWSADDGGERK